MLLEGKKVAIIGAGPVGLTMAKLLEQKGVSVTVYERDKDQLSRIWGGTLDLHQGSGQHALKKAGLLDSYFEKAKPMGRTIADEKAKILFSIVPQHDTPEINRNDLRQLLIDSLKADTIVWNSKFKGLSEYDGKWKLHFGNQQDAIADIIIGANGGLSSARKYVTHVKAEYTGTFIIQGEVVDPQINCRDFFQLCNNTILMIADNGINLVANPDNNGALTYNVTFRKPEKWLTENNLHFQDRNSVAMFLLDMLSHWHESYKQLFRSTSFFVGLPTRKIDMDNFWHNNRPLPISLIGDAAHLMPPFAGKGVNTGLMDALILSENLTNGSFNNIIAAIADYEQKMFVYAANAQKETAENEIAMHQPGFYFQKRFSN